MMGNSRGNDGRLAAYPVYLIMKGAMGLFFAVAFTVTMVYQFTVAGLNPFQLVLVGTVLEATAFFCEVPTGLVADTYSRRLSVIIGIFLLGISVALQGLFPTFLAILLCQVISGAGYTFISGADDAWLADEVGEAAAAPFYLRGAQVSLIGALLGTFVSVGLASVRLALPIVVGGVALIGLALFLALLMPERGFAPTPQEDRNSFQKLAHTFGAGLSVVRASPILLTIIAVILFRGAASEAFDRLWQAHFVANFTFPRLGQLSSIVWFGIIAAAARVLSLGSTEFVRRRVDTATHGGAARALFVTHAVLIAATVGLGLAGNFGLAVGAYLLATVCRNTSYPVYTAWINQQTEPRVRATVLSMTSQSDALGQIAGGPILGAVGAAVSLRAAITAAGFVLLPILPLLARTIRRPVVGPITLAAADE